MLGDAVNLFKSYCCHKSGRKTHVHWKFLTYLLTHCPWHLWRIGQWRGFSIPVCHWLALGLCPSFSSVFICFYFGFNCPPPSVFGPSFLPFSLWCPEKICLYNAVRVHSKYMAKPSPTSSKDDCGHVLLLTPVKKVLIWDGIGPNKS